MKRLLSSAIFTLIPLIVFPQLGIFQNTVIDESFGIESPRKTILADADSDGDLDVFTYSSIGGLSWIPNLDGQGNYGTRILLPPVSGLTTIDVGDIDGDGDNDVVRGSSTLDEITWLENIDGQGTYGNSSLISDVLNNPVILKLVDVDNDSDLDLFLVYNQNAYRYGWFENIDGQGTFSAFMEIGVDSVIVIGIGFELFDIDGDGDLDFVMHNDTINEIFWFENIDGEGTFANRTILIDDFTDAVPDVHYADMDGDLDLDILMLLHKPTPNTDELVYYENIDGAGTYSSPTVIIGNLFDPVDVHTADVDNDGDEDILIAHTSGLNFLWIPNNGNGNFGNPIIYEDFSFLPTHVTAEDIDSDGDIDIINTSSVEDIISTYKNDGAGNLGPRVHINTIVNTPRFAVPADLDGDNDNDILGISSDGKVFWFENLDGGGTFGQQNVVKGNAFFGSKVWPLDFDNDGDLDIIYTYDEVIGWLENVSGTGDFVDNGSLYIDPSSSFDFTFVDVDNDNDLDLVMTPFSSNQLRWHENTGNSFNASGTHIPTGFGPSRVISADINADGFMDLVVSGSLDDTLVWYPNLGNGTFDNFVLISTEITDIRFSKLIVADMDGDSDLDLIVGSPTDNNIVWFENTDGAGNFSMMHLISDEIGMNFTAVVFDADLDGDNDVIISDNVDNIIKFLENIDGIGTFEVPQELLAAENTLSNMTIGDFNSDFRQDLLAVSLAGNFIHWFENLGVLENVITGNVAIDLENDGCDPEDPNMQNILINTSNGTYQFGTVTDANGNYTIYVTDGVYTTEITSSLPTYYGPDPEFHISDFTGTNTMDIADFCVIPLASVSDLSATLYPLNEARPGFEANYQLVFDNIGTNVMNGSIELNFDSVRLEFFESSEPVSSSTPEQIIFDYDNLLPFETRVIDISFLVAPPPITNIDDELGFFGTILPINNDINPEDNSFELIQIVVGSYDPNDIIVLEGPEVPIDDADQHLHYIIRFQNTGTASAINVRVQNILNSNLDWDTFQLQNTSHSVRVEINNGNIVQFIFDDINLPDSTSNEEGSKGYIQYKIKPIETVMVGDQVLNDALIYFDFNSAIITNTVSTTFVDITPPTVITQDITVSLDQNGTVSIEAIDVDNGSFDNSTPTNLLEFELDVYSFFCGDLGSNQVTLTVTDLSGNSAADTAIVTVEDDLAPMVLTQDITVDLAGSGSVTIVPEDIDDGSTDNCQITSLELDQDTFTAPGNYTVTLTASDASNNEDSATAIVTVINTLGIPDQKSFELTVVPNPTSGILTVISDTRFDNFRVIDLTGRVIAEYDYNTTYDLSNLSAGFYLLVFELDTGLSAKRSLIKK